MWGFLVKIDALNSINFKNNYFEIKTQRTANDISQLIIDRRISNSQEIRKNEKRQEELIEKYDKNVGLLRNAPILDRFDYAIAKLKQGEYVSATTMGILSILYGPEDLREVSSAYKQIKAFVQDGEFVKEYDYKTAQHPFSFFRGSILHKALNPFATRDVDLDSLTPIARWWHTKVLKAKRFLLGADKALIDTMLGKKVLNFFDIRIKKVEAKIEDIPKIDNIPQYINAYEFISDNKLGKLTVRAMTRVPVIGTIADAAIEALEVRNDIKDGENFFEAAGKATVRCATSTITTAYLGAIGSKFGPIGSLGSLTVANYINEKVEEAIE